MLNDPVPQRFYGLYRGTCVDPGDPESRGRIRLRCPDVLATEVSDWAWPCRSVTTVNDQHSGSQVAALLATSPAGTGPHTHGITGSGLLSHLATPTLNQGVWVMFEAGDPDRPVWVGVY